MKLTDLVADFLERKRATFKRPTIACYRTSLRRFVAWMKERGVRDAEELTRGNVAAFGTALTTCRRRAGKFPGTPERPLDPGTVYAWIGHVRRFLTHARAIGEAETDLSSALARHWSGHHLPRRTLSEAEAVRMMTAPDGSTALGLRDRAMLELLYGAGLRISEVMGLDLGDVDLSAGTVFIRHGKGDRQRLVPIGAKAVSAVRLYLERGRPELLTRSRPTVALFLSSSRGGRLGHRIARESLSLRVQRAARLAGIERHVTAHALRHAVATHLVRAGASIRHVQEILGHSRIDTTERYVAVAIPDLIAVHARTHPRGRAIGASGGRGK